MAIESWLSAAKINSGHIFRGIRGNAEISNSLCESRNARIYKTLARRAGLSEHIIKSISGHSMRVGGAQDLLLWGATLPQILIKGGWGKTDTMIRYVDLIRIIFKRLQIIYAKSLHKGAKHLCIKESYSSMRYPITQTNLQKGQPEDFEIKPETLTVEVFSIKFYLLRYR
jgi:hypothetical protein